MTSGNSKDAASVAPAGQGTSVWAALPYISAYWVAAIGVIFMNAGILRSMHCPAALTAWHMLCCSVLVRVVRLVAPQLFDQSAPELTLGTIMRRVAPIGVLFALTLGVGNRAYVHLSVAFIQMVKAAHPVITYVISCLIGAEAFLQNKLTATMFVTFGVMLSVTGELNFDSFGFACQMFGSLTECFRVVLIGLLLSKQGLKLDPLTALSYYSPIAFLVLVPLALATEFPSDVEAWRIKFEAEVGFLWMAINGLTAFTLNIAVVSLISKTDPVVYVVVGVLKDIFTVIISGFVLTTPVTNQQVVGYLMALAGVQVFNLVQKNPDSFKDGVWCGLWAMARGVRADAREQAAGKGYSPVNPNEPVSPAAGTRPAQPAATTVGASRLEDEVELGGSQS